MDEPSVGSLPEVNAAEVQPEASESIQEWVGDQVEGLQGSDPLDLRKP
jgi:hypothetical protein